jgi:hypothetical protein
MFLLGKLKMYAALIGAALVAIVTAYYRGRTNGQTELEYEIKDDRIEKILEAKGVQDDVQVLDDHGLLRRSGKWLRKDNG